LICVDASGWGFAALHVDHTSGHVQVHQEKWNQNSNLRSNGSVLLAYNEVHQALRHFKARVVLTHIAGTSNPFDALSRGTACQDASELAHAAKAILPAGQLEASVRPFGAPYGRR
jgi:hypothetical protein